MKPSAPHEKEILAILDMDTTSSIKIDLLRALPDKSEELNYILTLRAQASVMLGEIKKYLAAYNAITVHLSYKNVFNTNLYPTRIGDVGRAEKIAKANGYPFYLWNDIVYQVDATRLNVVAEDIEPDHRIIIDIPGRFSN